MDVYLPKCYMHGKLFSSLVFHFGQLRDIPYHIPEICEGVTVKIHGPVLRAVASGHKPSFKLGTWIYLLYSRPHVNNML